METTNMIDKLHFMCETGDFWGVKYMLDNTC